MAASARKNSRKKPTKAELVSQAKLRAEVSAFILFAVGIFLFIAIFLSSAGKLGSFFSGLFFGLFGLIAYTIPLLCIFIAIILFLQRMPEKSLRPIILVSIIFLMINLIIAGFFLGGAADPLNGMSFKEVWSESASRDSGGLIGMYIGWGIVKLLGKAGFYIFAIVVLIVSVLLLINTPLSPYIDTIRDKDRSRRERRQEEREAYREYRDSLEVEQPQVDYDDNQTNPPYVPSSSKNGRFWQKSENLASKQKNIVTHVQNDFDHIHNEDPPKTETGLDGYNMGGAGLGLDPMRPNAPGTGLGDSYNESYISSIQKQPSQPSQYPQPEFDPEPEPEPFIDEVQKEGVVAQPISIDPEEPFTMSDLNKDLGSDSYESFLNETMEDKPPSVPVTKETTSTNKVEPKPAPVKAEPKPLSVKSGFNSDEKMLKYKLPPVDLLSKSPKKAETNLKELETTKRRLEQALSDFNVQARVSNAIVGPTVTRYEVEPAVGVKIQSIKSLESDLALKLEVDSVRVVPMPGKAVIGIEAYNKKSTLITLRDIIDSPEFRTEESMLGFALGMDISGKKIITDLTEMPHLLIAGTTGSGKSVCLNSIILSILYRAKPNEVKFILIDPKQVELNAYNGISHLLLPVVTDPEKAAVALGYAVTQMEERYRKFAQYGVRNLEGYNNKVMTDDLEDEELFPQIVIVIDELSDLMMTAPAKVQEYINRLAAKARAAGIHLIVATQQPLASILTSVIKANIPSRIGLSVTSNSASRVILDEPGAEQLRGKGDMLFKSVSMREPVRIQGPWVSPSEIFKVTEYIKKQLDSEYSPDIMEFVNDKPTGQLTEDEDEFFRDAVAMVVAAKQASVSMIQRRFRIGYNRAARLVDMMEEMGIVAASDGSNKARKVIMSEEQLSAFLGEDIISDDSISNDSDAYDDNDESANSDVTSEDDDLPPFTINEFDE